MTKVPWPEYNPPGAEEQALLEQYGGFEGLFGGLMGEAGAAPGALSTIMPLLGRLGKFVGKGRKLGEKYETAATKRLQQTGKGLLKGLRQEAGAAGRLGSTVMGVDMADLGQRYATERAGIGAQAAQISEQAVQGRLGLGIQGLGALGGAAESEKGQMMGLAGLGLSGDEAARQQMLNQLGIMGQFRREPWEAGMQEWGQRYIGYQKPPSVPSQLLGGLGTIATGVGAFGGWGGGGGKYGGYDLNKPKWGGK